MASEFSSENSSFLKTPGLTGKKFPGKFKFIQSLFKGIGFRHKRNDGD